MMLGVFLGTWAWEDKQATGEPTTQTRGTVFSPYQQALCINRCPKKVLGELAEILIHCWVSSFAQFKVSKYLQEKNSGFIH